MPVVRRPVCRLLYTILYKPYQFLLDDAKKYKNIYKGLHRAGYRLPLNPDCIDDSIICREYILR